MPKSRTGFAPATSVRRIQPSLVTRGSPELYHCCRRQIIDYFLTGFAPDATIPLVSLAHPHCTRCDRPDGPIAQRLARSKCPFCRSPARCPRKGKEGTECH